MKNYNSDEVKSWNWIKKRDYIPASDAIGDVSLLNWKIIERYPIEYVKHNQAEYPNSVDLSEVLYMMNNFYPFGFCPIRINKNGELQDGLHRLTFAKMACLKFIDVFVE